MPKASLENSLQDYLGYTRMHNLDAKQRDSVDAYVRSMKAMPNFYTQEKVELGKVAAISYIEGFNPRDPEGNPAYPAYLMRVEGIPDTDTDHNPNGYAVATDDEDECCDGEADDCCDPEPDPTHNILADFAVVDAFENYSHYHGLNGHSLAAHTQFAYALRAEVEEELNVLSQYGIRSDIECIHATLTELRQQARNAGLWFNTNFGLQYQLAPVDLLRSVKTQLDSSIRGVNMRIMSDMSRPSVPDQAAHIEIAKGLEDLRRKVLETLDTYAPADAVEA